MRVIKSLLSVAVLLWAPMALAEETGQISVTGYGLVSAAPDMANVSVGVSHRAKDPQDAMDHVSNVASALIANLKSLGVAEKDVQTTRLSLHPVQEHYQNKQPKIIGFDAQTMLSVTVRDLDSLGTILSAMLTDGANQLGGINFGLQDDQALRDQARLLAVQDGLRKAGLYAEAAGVTLGDLKSLSEGGVSHMPKMDMRMAMAESVPVAQGSVDLSQNVSMVFAINP